MRKNKKKRRKERKSTANATPSVDVPSSSGNSHSRKPLENESDSYETISRKKLILRAVAVLFWLALGKYVTGLLYTDVVEEDGGTLYHRLLHWLGINLVVVGLSASLFSDGFFSGKKSKSGPELAIVLIAGFITFATMQLGKLERKRLFRTGEKNETFAIVTDIDTENDKRYVYYDFFVGEEEYTGSYKDNGKEFVLGDSIRILYSIDRPYLNRRNEWDSAEEYESMQNLTPHKSFSNSDSYRRLRSLQNKATEEQKTKAAEVELALVEQGMNSTKSAQGKVFYSWKQDNSTHHFYKYLSGEYFGVFIDRQNRYKTGDSIAIVYSEQDNDLSVPKYLLEKLDTTQIYRALISNVNSRVVYPEISGTERLSHSKSKYTFTFRVNETEYKGNFEDEENRYTIGNSIKVVYSISNPTKHVVVHEDFGL